MRYALDDYTFNNTEELRKHAKENGLKFYPTRSAGFLNIENDVEQYIRKKAREDIPESQFTCSSALKYPRDKRKINERMMEIGGVLGFNGIIYELAYSKDCEISHNIDGRRLYSTTRVSRFINPSDLKEGTSTFINWHTHARNPNLSKKDAESGNALMDIFSDFLYYEVIYCPAYDRFSWYEYDAI